MAYVTRLNSANTLVIDDASPILTLNMTVTSTSYQYILYVNFGGSQVDFFSISAQPSTGTFNVAVAIPPTVKPNILNAMTDKQSVNAIYLLDTYSGTTKIGDSTATFGTIQTTEANSAPAFSNSNGFVYADNNSSIVTITGSNQSIVQNYSSLLVTAYSATAKNGATIKQYEAVIGDIVVTSQNTTLNCGNITKAGNLTLTVKAIDSRGYAAVVTKTISIIAYEDITITAATAKRTNDVEAMIQATFSADISPITVSAVNKNGLIKLWYRYKLTSSSTYGNWVNITASATVTSTKITYTTTGLLSLPVDNSYHLQFAVGDKLSSDYSDNIIIAAGIPLMAKRKKKVGINIKEPRSALDVIGIIMQNGFNVLGYVGTVTGDFNNYTAGGIYTYGGTGGTNAPGAAGFMEVITDGSYVIQRFTEYSSGCKLYVRSYLASGTWTPWILK